MKKRRVWVIMAAVALVCAGAFGWWQWNESRQWPALMEKISALPADMTAEELAREGFMDVTEVQSGPVKEVTQLIQGQRRILSYFVQTENGPLIHIFTVDKDRLLAAYTYSVPQKKWQWPNTGFSFQITYEEDENGVTEVWIHDATGLPKEEDQIPNWTDYLLYRFS